MTEKLAPGDEVVTLHALGVGASPIPGSFAVLSGSKHPKYVLVEGSRAEVTSFEHEGKVTVRESGKIVYGVPVASLRLVRPAGGRRSPPPIQPLAAGRRTGRASPTSAKSKPEPEFIYHVTTAAKLPSIAEHGLVPSRGTGGGVGRYGYQDWSRGKVFLTGKRDAFYWHGRVEAHAEDQTDDLRGDRAVPVVLRVKNLRRMLQADTVARSEGQDDSYFVRRRIPPGQLQVFDGQRWVSVERYSDEDEVEEFVDRHLEHVVGEEDEGEWDVLVSIDGRDSTLPPELRP